MRTLVLGVVLALVTVAVPTTQQTTAAPASFPLVKTMFQTYHQLDGDFAAAAELMPEADYAFKATVEVRSFGQLVLHAALHNMAACSTLGGQKNPHRGESENTTHSKAELMDMVKEAARVCETAFGAMTDASMTEMLTPVPDGSSLAKGIAFVQVLSHTNEMYGTMSVYLRLKGLIPPSTARQKPVKKSGDS